jgi:hypothetical protein
MKVAKKSAFGGNWQFNPGFQNEEPDVVQEELPIEKRNQLADKLMEELIVTPFIQCLNLVVKHGADPHVQV